MERADFEHVQFEVVPDDEELEDPYVIEVPHRQDEDRVVNVLMIPIHRSTSQAVKNIVETQFPGRIPFVVRSKPCRQDPTR